MKLGLGPQLGPIDSGSKGSLRFHPKVHSCRIHLANTGHGNTGAYSKTKHSSPLTAFPPSPRTNKQTQKTRGAQRSTQKFTKFSNSIKKPGYDGFWREFVLHIPGWGSFIVTTVTCCSPVVADVFLIVSGSGVP